MGEFFNFYVPDERDCRSRRRQSDLYGGANRRSKFTGWLHFNAQTLNFWGTPGRGDTDTYAVRALGIMLTASDEFNQASVPFTINVGGTSYPALAINIGLPLLSGLVSLYEAYQQRALCLNRCNKKRYQKLQQTAETGGEFSYPLTTPLERVIRLLRNCRGRCMGVAVF